MLKASTIRSKIDFLVTITIPAQDKQVLQAVNDDRQVADAEDIREAQW